MMPLLFINLDRDAERRARLEAELKRLDIAGERFPATLWTALSDSEQASYYSSALNERVFHKPLVNGEKGCYASHLRAWQWLLDSSHPALVVLEDDVRLKPEFARVVEAIATLPAGWDMVKLLGRPATGKAEKLRGQHPLTGGYELVDYARIPSLTAGYVISRSGAEKLLTSRLPFGRPIDVDLRHFWENGLRIQGVEPAAIELDETSFESSIGDKPKGGLAARWRKFRHKAAYSVLNRWNTR
ncbi:glycosyltransferase family 25 protein [Pelomonas sp. SE-A7]|uniref:glycosyltransferase family 25 protein n=1 Tax=Pelomonas sp. SE-A7 TaxID=3054953 RepID=UPI00259CEE5F|nr:glycosyltransferase family 25 protein [Pelomonas sp. SE-A7]MDM4765551.1 glycosyltransferase family 25 protein [Pelomonas sp. SE-A7]